MQHRLFEVAVLAFTISFSLVAVWWPTPPPPHEVGQMGYRATGTYEVLDGSPTLHMSSGYLRLIFFCVNGNVVTTADNTTPGYQGNEWNGDEWCNLLPYAAGEVLTVRGTLLTPSEAGPQFVGDLYVFQVLDQ